MSNSTSTPCQAAPAPAPAEEVKAKEAVPEEPRLGLGKTCGVLFLYPQSP